MRSRTSPSPLPLFISLLSLSLPSFAQNASVPTTNSSLLTSITLPLSLSSCTPSSFLYTAPPGPKYLGWFVSGTNRFIETYRLPEAYDERTNGTFVWNCDLPPGLSVAAMFYVIEEGASGTDGHQTTTPDTIISAGTTLDCLGQNDPNSQQAIWSLASSLDPTFTATTNPASSTGNANKNGNDSGNDKGSSTPVGAIIGGVIGGLALIILLVLLLIYMRKKHDQANGANLVNDGASVYSGWTEKTRREQIGTAGGGGGGGGVPPPGTYYATDPEGNTASSLNLNSILVMGQEPNPSSSPPLLNHQQHHQPQSHEPSVLETPMSPPHSIHGDRVNVSRGSPGVGVGGLNGNVPKVTAPMGTLPEPMGDDDSSPPRRPDFHQIPTGYESYQTANTSGTRTPGTPFEPQSEREGFFANQRRGGPGRGEGGVDAYRGLDDPESFVGSGRR
ncbi:hypothetical protein JCM16303_003162 [Sporobolomyces ruberrimus]